MTDTEPTSTPDPAPAYELAAIDSLELHPDNPRRGDLAMIAESIATNGFYGGVIAQRSRRRIIAGAHRWRALRQLQADGYKPAGERRARSYDELRTQVSLPPLGLVPVLWSDVDDATATRMLLIDNRANDVAGYDDATLARLLSSQRDNDALTGTGFNERDTDDLLAKLNVPDLDDLAQRLGESSVSDFWPVLRLKVHPETKVLWDEVVHRLAGADAGDDDSVRAVLRALPTS